MRRSVVRLLRVAGSIVLLGAVILWLPRGELVKAFRNASPWIVTLATVTFVLCHFVAAFKWRMLMGRATDVSRGRAVRAHFTGLVGNLSPFGMIGGDVVRAGVAIDGSAQSTTIVLTSVVDRLIDTAALLLLAIVGFFWIGGRSSAAGYILASGSAVAVVGILALGIALKFLSRSETPLLADLRDAVQVLHEEPALVARALALSILIQGTLIAANAEIGASVGVECTFAAWLMAWPAAKFAAYVPIGVAGIGVRETVLVALLTPLGGAAGPVLAAGLLWNVVLISGSLGGWLFQAVARTTLLPMVRRLQNT
jgi:uncharacterized membrane protein YbhN (UPF0104 family)